MLIFSLVKLHERFQYLIIHDVNQKILKTIYFVLCAQTEVEGRKVPTKIKPLAPFRVVDMILGPHHSAVLVESGVLYTFGRNTNGQLGLSNTKPREAPMQVREMSDRVITVS